MMNKDGFIELANENTPQGLKSLVLIDYVVNDNRWLGFFLNPNNNKYIIFLYNGYAMDTNYSELSSHGVARNIFNMFREVMS